MRTSLAIASVAVATAFAAVPAHADHGQVDHAEGKPAPNLEAAVQNLREYNRKLDQRLSQELDGETLHEIHMLSYTLENALQRLDKDLASIANVLEGMHLASERGDVDAVKSHARTYLENTRLILGGQ